MEIYKIKDIARGEPFYSVAVSNSKTRNGAKSTFKTINIPQTPAKTLKVGQRILVIQDKFCPTDDYAYVYRGGISLNYKPASYDKYSCKSYVNCLPSMFSVFNMGFDRAVFKIVIAHECLQRGLVPSFSANN